MKYVIQYTLPYEHRVMVGIEAETPEAASGCSTTARSGRTPLKSRFYTTTTRKTGMPASHCNSRSSRRWVPMNPGRKPTPA